MSSISIGSVIKSIAVTTAVIASAALLAKRAGAATAPLIEQIPKDLPYCGSLYAPPYASGQDGRKKRICARPSSRNYTPKHRGIGFEALDIESKGCFVPDSAYQLLDDIIDTVTSRLGPDPHLQGDDEKSAWALKVSRLTGEVMVEKGFGLFIPTETLGDALTSRSEHDESPRHIVDCDTGSLIVLSVADALGMQAALVEITLSSGAGHNFVRWRISDHAIVDWDTNGRAQCAMPLNNPTFQGRSMTHDQTISYLLTLRAARWMREGNVTKALEDNRAAIQKFPEHPTAYNNFIWDVASTAFPERSSFEREAVGYVDKLLHVQRNPNNLDTVACIFAFSGDYTKAVLYEDEALKGDPGNGIFMARAAQFRSTTHHDCTGEK